MSYNSTFAKIEETVKMSRVKCMCGNHAQLTFKAKLGRVRDQMVTVYNVPVYSCGGCGSNFMNGSDSLKFAKKVDEAIEKNMETITF